MKEPRTPPHVPPPAPELLAPAGDAASLAVALQGGADAVYFGLQEGFNARARAGNFALENLAATVSGIHRAGARAYLALNTVIFEPELPFVESVIRAADAAGVDALLVQDPAVALLARRVAPELALHASTQMTISSPEAAVFALDLGARRVVLPRELSVDEIAAFVRGTALEAEVFVHGALCVAWSGQCLTSEAWGGRSANRGECAQSCRMPYELVLDGERRDLGDVRYLLSPKDLSGARAVPRLVALGVRGLKIEGRQKGPQYVATALQGYRRWLDAIVRGEHASPEAVRDLQDDLLAMTLAFSRGFGDGFLAGNDHQTLVEGRFPKHRGVYLGRVRRVERDAVHVAIDHAGRPWTGARALGDAARGPVGEVSSPLPPDGGRSDAATGAAAAELVLKPGMGIVFDSGHPEDKREPGGPVFAVEPRGRGRVVLRFGKPGPDLRRVSAGERVWVTSDPSTARFTERAQRAPQRLLRQPLHVAVAGRIGEPLRVSARVEGRPGSFGVESSTRARRAAGPGITAALLRDKLGALGNTCYTLGGLDTSALDPGLHVPVSQLKAMRRELIAALGEPEVPRRPSPAPAPPAVDRPRFTLADLAPVPSAPELVPLCRSTAQLEAVIEAGLTEVELDWMEMVGLGTAVRRAREADLRVILATLRVQKPGEEAIDERLLRLEPAGILVRHWGGMVAFARRRAASGAGAAAGLRLHGDFSLNVTNSVAAHHLFGWGLDTITAAHDLDEAQLFALLATLPAGRAAVVLHHRIPTFHTEHCVYAHLLSNGRDHRTCGRPCEAHEVGLRDHQGRVHPVIVDAGCRNTVFNSQVQSAAALVPRLLGCGVKRFRVEFVRETAAEAAAVLAAYQALLAGRTSPNAVLASLPLVARHGVSAGPMQLLQ